MPPQLRIPNAVYDAHTALAYGAAAFVTSSGLVLELVPDVIEPLAVLRQAPGRSVQQRLGFGQYPVGAAVGGVDLLQGSFQLRMFAAQLGQALGALRWFVEQLARVQQFRAFEEGGRDFGHAQKMERRK